jgi:hypothetical protein
MFLKNVVLHEIYSKKITVIEYFWHVSVFILLQAFLHLYMELLLTYLYFTIIFKTPHSLAMQKIYMKGEIYVKQSLYMTNLVLKVGTFIFECSF